MANDDPLINSKISLVNAEGRGEPIKYFLNDDRLKILLVWESVKTLGQLFVSAAADSSTYIFILTGWCLNSSNLMAMRREFEILASSFGPDICQRIVLLANSRYECHLAKYVLGPSARTIHVNQNWLLNPDTFRLDPGIKKTHDAVVNSRAVAWKRHHLTRKIKDKIYVTYFRPGELTEQDLISFGPANIHSKLRPSEVSQVLQSAYVGVICSEVEGGCFSSTEYLLSGLPVVSTPSVGGRSEWYDDYSAVICPPFEDDVRGAVEMLRARIEQGEVSPLEVRRRAIQKSYAYRNAILNTFNEIAFDRGLSIPFEDILARAFSKSGEYRLSSCTNTQFVKVEVS